MAARVKDKDKEKIAPREGLALFHAPVRAWFEDEYRPVPGPPNPADGNPPNGLLASYSSSRNAEMNASCGTSTRPIDFIRFFPSFCLSRSFLLRVMSPP